MVKLKVLTVCSPSKKHKLINLVYCRRKKASQVLGKILQLSFVNFSHCPRKILTFQSIGNSTVSKRLFCFLAFSSHARPKNTALLDLWS